MKVVVALVIILVAGVLLWKNSGALNVGASEADAKLTPWLCSDPECKNEFTLTMGKSRQMRADAGDPAGPLECPKCHKITGEQAADCPACGRYAKPVTMGMFPAVCPHCKTRFREDDHGHSPAPTGHK